ncbi:MAG: TetR/AcrR family transcriptional regulator [Deltaproteobacteria bacterium]|nr:TetR/AcrR family transcriptional regulator [Deltaproteobacteria bacterium]
MSPAPSRRAKETARRRSDVLEAAVEVFAVKGFHDTAMTEIAAQAEFSLATIYKLFPGGKEEIYQATQERVVASFERELAALPADPADPLATLREYLAASGRVYAAHPREMTLHLREAAGLGFDLARGLPPELAARYRASADRAVSALAAALEQGLLRPLPLSAAVVLWRAVINALLLEWLEAGRPEPLAQRLALVETAFFRGLLGLAGC